ncbi:hypothetical protein CLOSTHATH_02310 [Hungatella hathewayi DSM 13479]|jgi:hypothetical protein|uniref:Uncharacterized protein n=1 Tax=Hungatella hathewayi DSM 13479 TaxID=566550 RepID=D3AFC5_9FIRM|nr:hypothetical protein CLOSTHATH_02310 [Hungatella hathewayi DSM 13479]
MMHFYHTDPVKAFGDFLIMFPGNQAVIKVKTDRGHLGIAGTDIGKNSGCILGVFSVYLNGWVWSMI